MVKLNTSLGELVVEFNYDVERGETHAFLLKEIPEGVKSAELVASGWAIKANEDKWNKLVARKVALARAFDTAKFTREERAFLWDQFFSQCKRA